MSSTNKSNPLGFVKALTEIAKKESTQKDLNKPNHKRINVNFKKLGLVLVYITTLFVTAIAEFVNTRISLDYVISSEFISKFILHVTTNWLILFTVFLYVLSERLRKDLDYLTIAKDIHNRVEKSDSSIFEVFMGVFNRQRRKNKYKKVLRKQKRILDKKANKEDLMMWLQGTEEDKLKNEYCATKQDILDRLEEDYIEEHIDDYYVPLKETTSDFVKHGYKKAQDEDQDNWDIENGFWKVLKDLGPKLFLSLVVMFALQTIIPEQSGEVGWKAMFIAVALRLYPIAINTWIGLTYAGQYFNEKIMIDLHKRNDILELEEQFEQNFKAGKIEVQEKFVVENPIVLVKQKEVLNNG